MTGYTVSDKDGGGAAPRTMSRARILLAQIRDRALKRLPGLLSEMLDKTDDALFDFAQSDGSSRASQDYFDAMRELRRQRPLLEQRYVEHLEQAFAALERGQPLEVDLERSLTESRELSLISEEQLEEQLGSSMVAVSLTRLLGASLNHLNHRLGLLAQISGLDFSGNPLAPPHVAYAFRHALQACELSIRIKVLLFKLYERQMAQGLAAFYNETNQALIEAGVAPEIRPAYVRMPQTVAPARRDAHRPEDAAAAAPSGEDVLLPAPGPGERYIRVPETLAEQSVFASLHELLSDWRRHQSEQGVSETDPDGHGGASGGGQEEALIPQMSGAEVMSVLSLFQSEMPPGLQEAVSDPDSSVTQRIKQELMRGAEQLGLDPRSRMTEAVEDSVDLVGMLFDVMLDERDFNPASRQLIGRLIVPFIKVAMLDRRMFLQKTHPARRLLNALAEACEGNEGRAPQERELMARAGSTIDRLVAEFNEDIAIFDVLEQEFRDFIEQHRRRVALAERRTTEAQRGKERLEQARASAMRNLQALLERHPGLPAAIEAFLRRYWTHHLTLCALRDEDGGTGKYADAVVMGESLAELAQGQDAGPARAEQFEAMRAQLNPVLLSAGCIGSAADEVLQSLRQTLGIGGSEPADVASVQQSVSALERNAPPLESLSETVALAGAEQNEAEASMEAAPLDYDESDAERVRKLQLGCWVQFVEESGNTVPAKLSWVSPISNRMLFVNRRGLRYCVASSEELAAMMRQGRLNIRQNDAAFEHAMSQVLGQLRSGSGTRSG